MRESLKSALRIGCAVGALVAFAATPALAASASSNNDGKGFAGLLRMFDIFSSHHEDKAAETPAPSPAPATTQAKSAVKVTVEPGGERLGQDRRRNPPR